MFCLYFKANNSYNIGMKTRTLNTVKGAGSLVDIAGSGSAYSQYVPKGTATERIAASWIRVGQSIRKATGDLKRERKA